MQAAGLRAVRSRVQHRAAAESRRGEEQRSVAPQVRALSRLPAVRCAVPQLACSNIRRWPSFLQEIVAGAEVLLAGGYTSVPAGQGQVADRSAEIRSEQPMKAMGRSVS